MIEILRSLGLTEEAGQCIVSKTGRNSGVKGEEKEKSEANYFGGKGSTQTPQGQKVISF